MLPKLSSFFQVVSKEMHVSLSNVENVREKEKFRDPENSDSDYSDVEEGEDSSAI